MKKILLITGLFLSVAAKGQTVVTPAPAIQVTPPSPEVNVIQRYGEYGCSGYTGKVDITIPLYEINSNQLNLPISLKYVSNGKKVVSDRSSVGTGWMLDAGGIVSRTIYGMPDMDVEWFYSLKLADQYWDFKANYDTLSRLAGVGKGYLDSEYDIFSYTFGSHSGRFIVDQKKDKKTFVLINQEPVKIEYTVDYNFTLTDAYGNQYKYGENGKEKAYAANNKLSTTAWYPSEIISADKRDTITIKYNPFNVNSNVYNIEFIVEDNARGHYKDKTEFHEDQSGPKEYVYQNCRISEISFSGGTVKFIYNSFNKDKLESIDISDRKGTVIKSIILESKQEGSTDRGGAYYLEKLTFKGQGATAQSEIYKFDYYTPFEFDPRNCDWWGYANKLTEQYSMGLPFTKYTLFNPLSLSSEPEHTFGTIGAKDANTAAVLSGMLKTITYPTGGKTTFEYELNKFSTNGMVVSGNGLRVLKLTNDDGTGKKEIKSYTYGTDGTGRYPNLPKLEYFSRIYHYAYIDENFKGYDNDPFNIYGSYRQRRYNTGPSSSASEEINRPVQYEFVTEYLGDSVNNTGKTEYQYNKVDGGGITRMQSRSGFPEKSYIMEADLSHYHVSTLNDYAEGRLLRKTVSKKDGNSYKEVYKLENTYDFNTLKNYTGMRVVDLVIADAKSGKPYPYLTPTEALAKDCDIPVFLYSDYSITIGACILNKTEEYVNGILTLTENTYTPGYLPRSVSTTNSNNVKITNTFTYSTDIDNVSDSIFNVMSKNNMTGIPVETVTNIKKNGTDYVTNAVVNLYKNSNGVVKPEKIYTLSVSDPITNYQKLTGNALWDSRMELNVTYEKYDSKSNILQFTTRAGITNCYLWSYNYQYPIAEIKNATYADVVNALSGQAVADRIAGATEPAASDLMLINNLRTNANFKTSLITTYTYKPLVGILTMTDPRGVVTKYDYDSFGRLIKLTRDNKVIETYDYHYVNQ